MIVACVRTGTKYPFEYVERLFAMVERNMPPIAYQFMVLTDQPERHPRMNFIDVSRIGLTGWWAKMLLFQKQWRAGHSVIYFDLDTVICGDLSPLVHLAGRLADSASRLAICESWTRRAGNPDWPCLYGSCVMLLHSTLDARIWDTFAPSAGGFIRMAGDYGDQRAIELIEPAAGLLQPMLPDGFMCSYRSLAKRRPAELSVVNFGGSSKPHTCKIDWVKDQWR
jgi:hypothetical protein